MIIRVALTMLPLAAFAALAFLGHDLAATRVLFVGLYIALLTPSYPRRPL